jgi:hypothetical protein
MPQTFQSDESLPATGCLRQDIYDLIHNMVPLAGLVDSDVLQILGDEITAANGLPTWHKYTKAYTDFSTAALTNNIDLFTLPAGGVIQAVKLKHSVAFTGGAISSYTISVGITGTLAKYLAAFNVFPAVTATNHSHGNTIGGESHTASTVIKAAATSVGANLSAATAGSVDIWVLWAVIT